MQKLAIGLIHLILCTGAWCAKAQVLQVRSLQKNGNVSWDGAFATGVCLIEKSTALKAPWVPLLNVFTTNLTGSAHVDFIDRQACYRLSAFEISADARGFTNLCACYGTIRTVAGKGEFSSDGYNGWDPKFEGGPATAAELSRPHMAMADDIGNIFIADKDGNAIRKVAMDGNIFTVAGTGSPGDDGNTPGPGTALRLSAPNGLWVRGDGTLYILDVGNSKVRRLDTAGVLTTLFHVSNGIDIGRGLWVADDESLIYYSSGTALKKWTPKNGVSTLANGFTELGNLVVDPAGDLVVTDRGANQVFRVSRGGKTTPIAGNGKGTGGGDGAAALKTGLLGVRGVWFLPIGGYLLATHEGSQIWYVDPAGIIHLFLDGAPGVHDGDGGYFHSPGPKVSEVRAVTVSKQGRILITENDAGFIRCIEFLPETR